MGKTEFPVALAAECVDQVVVKLAHLFVGFRREANKDDLRQHALQEAWTSWPKFNHRKSSAKTYIYRVAYFRLFSFARRLYSRNGHRHRSIAESFDLPATEPDEAPEPSEPTDIVDWTGDVYRKARAYYATLPRPGRGRPRTYAPEQLATVAALRARKRMSFRGVLMLLGGNDRLRTAIDLTSIPPHPRLIDFEKVVRKSPTHPMHQIITGKSRLGS